MNNRIKELREREGLSQTQLAEKINASQQSISQWENHLKEVPMDIAVALSDYFHVTIDYLMCRTNQYCYCLLYTSSFLHHSFFNLNCTNRIVMPTTMRNK